MVDHPTKKGKKIEWWKRYKFKDEQQWSEWREWAKEELKKEYDEKDIVRLLNRIDDEFGMLYEWPVEIKKGELL